MDPTEANISENFDIHQIIWFKTETESVIFSSVHWLPYRKLWQKIKIVRILLPSNTLAGDYYLQVLIELVSTCGPLKILELHLDVLPSRISLLKVFSLTIRLRPVRCCMLWNIQRLSKTSLVNWVSLSVTTISGYPKCERTSSNFYTVSWKYFWPFRVFFFTCHLLGGGWQSS